MIIPGYLIGKGMRGKEPGLRTGAAARGWLRALSGFFGKREGTFDWPWSSDDPVSPDSLLCLQTPSLDSWRLFCFPHFGAFLIRAGTEAMEAGTIEPSGFMVFSCQKKEICRRNVIPPKKILHLLMLH